MNETSLKIKCLKDDDDGTVHLHVGSWTKWNSFYNIVCTLVEPHVCILFDG